MDGCNLEVMERIYRAFVRRDMDALLAGMDPDVVVVQDAPLPWGGRYRGRVGVLQFADNLLSHVEVRLEVDRLVPAGDYVLQIGHACGRVLRTGKEFRAPEVHVCRLRDGLVTKLQVFVDVPYMLAALS